MFTYLKKRKRLKRIRGRLRQLTWIRDKRSGMPEKVRTMLKQDISDCTALIERGHRSSVADLTACAGRLDSRMKKEYREWKQHPIMEMVREYLPVIILALGIKFFILGSYRVPSGSMMNNIYIGDNLFVIMCRYGLHIPFTDGQFVEFDDPDRGDIITFTGPPPERNALVKRVIGIPGDKIRLAGKSVEVNSTELQREYLRDFSYISSDGTKIQAKQYRETNTEGDHYNVLYISNITPSLRERLEGLCTYCRREFIVPERKYFAMGDNRDDSSDSRYWGFVSRKDLQGTPWFVWLSVQTGSSLFDVVEFRPGRIGSVIE